MIGNRSNDFAGTSFALTTVIQALLTQLQKRCHFQREEESACPRMQLVSQVCASKIQENEVATEKERNM